MVGVIWTYSGMSPDDMAKRVLVVSERAMTTTVNGIYGQAGLKDRQLCSGIVFIIECLRKENHFGARR